ncbi:MAG TPA: helix-turn-helix transcriptional regulator [Candidatus Sulfotelmatobacter sp.]|nr:helix-turn-helix transcriptional regulator [Candidatus Sulfotelmatobacter sp.]
MSVVFSHPQATLDRLSLADLLTPLQFKMVLLFAYGSSACEIAQVLCTTEQVIKNTLTDAYNRTGCRDSGELLRRYFRELADGALELGRLRRELAELEARVERNLHGRRGDLLRHIN